MSFLEAKPDLSEMCYSLSDLRIAQDGLTELIRKHCPAWLRTPMGILSERWRQHRWNGESAYNSCYLIEVFRIIDNIRRHVDHRSALVLDSKFCELLQAKKSVAFEATLSELQFCDLLISSGVPIELEPVVPKKSGEEGRPDLLAKLGAGVFIDVTRFCFSALDEWSASSELIAKELLKELGSDKGGGKLIQVTLPLESRDIRLERDDIRELAEHIMSEETGTSRISQPAFLVDFRWKTYPVIKVGETATITMETCDWRATGENAGFSAMIESSYPPIDASELLVKAIRARLDEKRKQFTAELPFVLAIRLGNKQQFPGVVFEIAKKRLWSNPQYRRISGILIFEHYDSFSKNLDRTKKVVIRGEPNPNAANPLPQEFIEIRRGD
jgi:hypothetical protein